MKLEEYYRSIGGDLETTVSRMGLTEQHLKRFLRRFRENREYAALVRAVDELDMTGLLNYCRKSD